MFGSGGSPQATVVTYVVGAVPTVVHEGVPWRPGVVSGTPRRPWLAEFICEPCFFPAKVLSVFSFSPYPFAPLPPVTGQRVTPTSGLYMDGTGRTQRGRGRCPQGEKRGVFGRLSGTRAPQAPSGLSPSTLDD